jgi:CHAT domain/Tetratricopeptide repeat
VQKLVPFDVEIEPRADGYRTRVVASPAGEDHTDFKLPFTDSDLENFILKVGLSIGRTRRKARRLQSQERRLLEVFGSQLFEAAFSGAVRRRLDLSMATAERKGCGLRIRLRLPSALANIPWEYLYDREYGFVSLSPETALVRYVDMPRPAQPLPISPPLRILAMIAAPNDVPDLSGEEEWDKINAALRDLTDRGMVEVDRLEAGTLSALQRPLRLREYHVLHFVGHGAFDEDAQDGALALEDRDGKTRLVTGRDLGLMIRGHRSLRLAVLNACEGARSAREDPFGGVAQALVRQGIPAVIAMQFEISDLAAVVFGHSFYQAIADGLPVDVAMVEARRAMFADGHEVEWATPVLYMRSPDGRVFVRSRVSDTGSQAREDTGRQAREDTGRQAREDTGRQAREDTGRQPQKEELRLRVQHAHSAGEAGDPRSARGQYAALLPVYERVLGPEHPDTLQVRAGLARRTGEAGDPQEARNQTAALLPVSERVLGREHPGTLAARAFLARWTGEAGAPQEARDQDAALLPVYERVLGPEHPGTLIARAGLARWTGRAGNPQEARDQYAALLPSSERVWGPEHPHTLDARAGLAYWTGEAGDPEAARDQSAALLPMYERVLGSEHLDTLGVRANLAYWTGEAGDPTAARDQYAALLPVYERVLGRKHPFYLTIRSNIDHWAKKAGRKRGSVK